MAITSFRSLICAGMLIVVCSAAATTNAPDGTGAPSPSRDGVFKRMLKFDIKKDSVTIDSKRKTDESMDSLSYAVRTKDGSDGVGIRMTASKNAKGKDKTRVGNFRSKLRLTCGRVLILDGLSDTAVGYQPAKDTIASTINLANTTFKDIVCTDEIKNSEEDGSGTNVTVKKCTLGTNDGSFSLTLEVAGGIFFKKKAKVNPTSIKFTIDLDGTLGASQYYALACQIQTLNQKATKGASTDGTKGQKLSFGDAGAAFFSWEDDAADPADNSAISVVASDPKDEGEVTDGKDKERKRGIYFTFLKKAARKIHWDPQVGAGEEFTEDSAASTIAFSSLTLLATILAFF